MLQLNSDCGAVLNRLTLVMYLFQIFQKNRHPSIDISVEFRGFSMQWLLHMVHLANILAVANKIKTKNNCQTRVWKVTKTD